VVAKWHGIEIEFMGWIVELSVGFIMFKIWPKDEVLVVEICQNTKYAHT
jgi:hypothetical protein